MKFNITREGAVKELNNFIETNLKDYSFKGNFDFGPNDKSNVSCLSPYITHRLITEFEVAKVLEKYSFSKSRKIYPRNIFGEFTGRVG